MLKAKGRYYELPIEGKRIHSIIYSRALRIIFGDSGESYLNLSGKFVVERYGQSDTLLPTSDDALLLFHHLLNAGTAVRTAKADKEGRLFLTFADNTEIIIAGPSEYWDFTRHNSQHSNNNCSVSGGLGYLDFLKLN